MHLQFLIEDMSGEILIDKVIEKIRLENSDFTYDCKSFKGIGGFKASGHVKDIKTNKLLNDLLIYLRGFDKSFANYSACIFVVLDNDNRNTEDFERELKCLAESANISVDYVFCIAVEEMEAWLLGDEKALFTAYPNAKQNKYNEYVQDSICGTWEMLAEIVFKGGLKNFKKECPTYREIGKYKAEWARDIGLHFQLNDNKSPSFQKLIFHIREKLDIA